MDIVSQIINATQSGSYTEVENCLNEGILADVQTSDGVTPLQIAAANGYDNIIHLLLTKEAQVDLPNKYGCGPLMLAARHGHTSTISLLLKKRAKVNVFNKLGMTPIVAAVWSGQLSTVNILLKAGAVIDHTPLPGIGLPDCDLTPLMAAALQGYDSILRMLLEEGASVNHASEVTGFTPLMLAACNGHKQTVQILVEWGGDANKVDICGRTALEIATMRNNHEVKTYLESVAASCSASGKAKENEILQAVRNDDILQVKTIICQDPVCLNIIDPQDGYTPLMVAAMLGKTDIAYTLVAAGANLDIQDFANGWTALMHSIFYRHVPIVHYLLEKGANVNICAKNGYTVLDLAKYLDNADKSIVDALTAKIAATESHCKPELVSSTVMLPILSRGKKLSIGSWTSPKRSPQQARLKGWFGSVAKNFQTMFPKTSTKLHDVSSTIPDIQVTDTTSPDVVFEDKNSTEAASPGASSKVILSLSALQSPNKYLASCLKKHFLEPVIPPLLSIFSNQTNNERIYSHRKISQDRSSRTVVALKTPNLLKSYAKRNAEGIAKCYGGNVFLNSIQDKNVTKQETTKMIPETRSFKSPAFKKTENLFSNPLPEMCSTPKSSFAEISESCMRPENEPCVSGSLTQMLERRSLERHIKKFKDQEVDIEAFQYLTEDDLKEIGVQSIGSLSKLLELITQLNKKDELS